MLSWSNAPGRGLLFGLDHFPEFDDSPTPAAWALQRDDTREHDINKTVEWGSAHHFLLFHSASAAASLIPSLRLTLRLLLTGGSVAPR